MFCRNCGAQIKEGSKFCTECGSPIQESNSHTSPAHETRDEWGSDNWNETRSSGMNPTAANGTYTGNVQRPMPNQGNYAQPNPNQGYYSQPMPGQGNYAQPVPPQQPKKKKKHGCLIALLVVVLVFGLLIVLIGWLFGDDDYYDDDYYDDDYYSDDYDSGDYDEDSYSSDDSSSGSSSAEGVEGTDLELSGLRNYYTDTASAESVTMMVYMIGADLESEDGCATSDLKEMLAADTGDAVTIVVQTGGASEWQNNFISADDRERWVFQNGEKECVDTLPQSSMTDASAVGDFIEWAASEYPADRYQLVFWDHGGGTVGGYGYDEVYNSDAINIEDLSDAIKGTGVKFDYIGFDACLMATVEVAYALEPCADYLIASEEYEPGEGWAYTDFLTMLGKDPSVDTVKLGKKIIDDYTSSYDNDDVTLSLIDLREVPNVYENLNDFLSSAEESIQQDNTEYKTLSKAVKNARSYCDGEIDQIDLVDMITRTDFDGKEDLQAAVESCVKYRNDSTLTGSNGMAIYFPGKTTLDSYDNMSAQLEGIGFTSPLEYYNYFLSIIAGRSKTNKSSNSVVSADTEDYSDESWYEEDQEEEFDYETSEDEELVLEETDDGFVLNKDEEFWDTITDIQLSVMVDDGEGYIDLGCDNTYEFTDDDTLLLDFDYTWVAIDGQIVPFYADETYEDENGSIIYSGTVYALLNDDTDIELYLEWEPQDGTDEDLSASVLGYRVVRDDQSTYEKGLRTLEKGDTLDFVTDYYAYDADDSESYLFGDTITVTSQEDLTVSYEEIADNTVICWYTLIDIYGQYLYTETIEFSLE